MRTHILKTAAILLGAFSGVATAQAKPGQIGFSAAGGGRSAGNICSGFACQPALLVGKPNITYTFTVRAPKGSAFFALVGPQGNLCQSVPGWSNSLVVAPILVLSGVVDQPDAGVNCFGAKGSFNVTIPGSVRKGARLAWQAIAFTKDPLGMTRPTFSSAIDLVVL